MVVQKFVVCLEMFGAIKDSKCSNLFEEIRRYLSRNYVTNLIIYQVKNAWY